MAKTMTNSNIREFLTVLEEFTNYPISDRTIDLAIAKYRNAEKKENTDAE